MNNTKNTQQTGKVKSSTTPKMGHYGLAFALENYNKDMTEVFSILQKQNKGL